jgi:hypothetical protein
MYILCFHQSYVCLMSHPCTSAKQRKTFEISPRDKVAHEKRQKCETTSASELWLFDRKSSVCASLRGGRAVAPKTHTKTRPSCMPMEYTVVCASNGYVAVIKQRWPVKESSSGGYVITKITYEHHSLCVREQRRESRRWTVGWLVGGWLVVTSVLVGCLWSGDLCVFNSTLFPPSTFTVARRGNPFNPLIAFVYLNRGREDVRISVYCALDRRSNDWAFDCFSDKRAQETQIDQLSLCYCCRLDAD